MKKWLRRISSAVGMGLTWAAGWALVGVLMAVITGFLPDHPLLSGPDPWMALATPGFVGGVVFSVVLWLAERGRRFNELSLPRLAAWGAVTGLLLGVAPFVLGTPSAEFSLWLLAVVIIGSTTLMCAVSAVASALLFRYVAPKQRAALKLRQIG